MTFTPAESTGTTGRSDVFNLAPESGAPAGLSGAVDMRSAGYLPRRDGSSSLGLPPLSFQTPKDRGDQIGPPPSEFPEVNVGLAVHDMLRKQTADLTGVLAEGPSSVPDRLSINPLENLDTSRSPIASLLGNRQAYFTPERNFDNWDKFLNRSGNIADNDAGDLTKRAIGLVHSDGDPVYNSREVARLPRREGASFNLPEIADSAAGHLDTVKLDMAQNFKADQCSYQRTMNPDGTTDDVLTRDDFWTLTTHYGPDAITRTVRDNFRRERIALNESFGPGGEPVWSLRENSYKSDRAFFASARRETSFDGQGATVASYAISDLGKVDKVKERLV